MSYNFVADSFHTQKNFEADFFHAKLDFTPKTVRPFCVLESPLGDLGATYDDHLRLIGKRAVDFLSVLIKLFFARCYG